MSIDGKINKISSYDNDQLRQIIKGASFDVLQMDAGQFEAQLYNLSLKGSALDGGIYRKKTLTLGTFAPDVVTFGLIHSLENYGLINGNEVCERDLTVAVDGSEMECFFHEDTPWSTYQIAISDLEKAGVVLEGKYTRFFRISAKEQLRLVEITRGILSYINEKKINNSSPNHLNMVNNFMISSYANAILADKDEIVSNTKSLELARKILKYIRENSNHMIQTIDLTTLTGKSERTLERIFRKHFRTTIATFVKNHRLLIARDMLIGADPENTTITDLSIECGFFNTSYFSSEYRRFFHETPTETLFR